ncbi:MAG: hypothetical protein OQL16_07575 [Gammaproteobacteria bacterium]|nr:hypothetical protein [Gammaproteobacteria bacterium]
MQEDYISDEKDFANFFRILTSPLRGGFVYPAAIGIEFNDQKLKLVLQPMAFCQIDV